MLLHYFFTEHNNVTFPNIVRTWPTWKLHATNNMLIFQKCIVLVKSYHLLLNLHIISHFLVYILVSMVSNRVAQSLEKCCVHFLQNKCSFRIKINYPFPKAGFEAPSIRDPLCVLAVVFLNLKHYRILCELRFCQIQIVN